MVTQLYRYERIRTTKAKALEVRRKAEKLITKAKEDTLHNRRTVAKLIQDKEILAKLFTEIAPGFVGRPGGYTRVLKLGYRKGDAAEMVLLELVEREAGERPAKKAKKQAQEEPTAEAGEDAVDESGEAPEEDKEAETVSSDAD
jgi:large subunit ribosomal protein L17